MSEEKTLERDSSKKTNALLERLMSEVETLKADNKLLKGIASKQRMADFQRDQLRNDAIKTAHLKVIGGKIVVKWETISDKVYVNRETGGIVEDQRMKVSFEDGTDEEMETINFHRQNDRVNCEIVSIDYEANKCVLLMPSGKEREFLITYLNP